MSAGTTFTQHQRAVAYYAVAAIVTAIGFVGIASIGIPFVFTGVLLFALGPVRQRRDVLWPPLLGVGTSFASFVGFGPISCSSTGGGRSRCVGAFGFELPGGGWAALGVTVAAGFGAALLLKVRLGRSGRAHA
jgi:hypothetical protein